MSYIRFFDLYTSVLYKKYLSKTDFVYLFSRDIMHRRNDKNDGMPEKEQIRRQ